MREFVIADIHGAYKALLDVFYKSGFDYKKDKLICLGDTCDSWPDTVECFDELMGIKNLIYIMGNHCEWNLAWLKFGIAERIWLSQGGQATVESFAKHYSALGDVTDKYIDFLKKGLYYYIDDKNRVFVHGGFSGDVTKESRSVLTWDRDLFSNNYNKYTTHVGNITGYKEVYVGHTTTQCWGAFEPLRVGEIWNLDTGAGWSGKLTIMDINTKKYWQSEFVRDYYPNIKGRDIG